MKNIPQKISSYDALEKLGRVRLSEHFFMREMLYSSIGDFFGLPNYPEDPQLAIESGTQLCQKLLEPLREKFGHIIVRSAYRSPIVNRYGNRNGFNCSSNENSAADHIWDLRDSKGRRGACVTVQIPGFMKHQEKPDQWTSLAWWIHDHLPYHSQFYFNQNGTLNLGWREQPEKWIRSYVTPRGYLTRKCMENWNGEHADEYQWMEDKYK